jgi:PAS domain S-box-containing protein
MMRMRIEKFHFYLAIILFCLVYWVADSIWSYLSFEENLRVLIFKEPVSIVDTFMLRVSPYQKVSRISICLVFIVTVSLLTEIYFKMRRSNLQRLENEERLRLITDNMIDVVSQMDAQRKIVYSSPSLKRVFGYKPNEIIGRSTEDWIHPDDRDTVFKSTLEAIKTQASSLRLEYRWRKSDGDYLWVESMARLLYDEQGGWKESVFCSRDISDRKRAEEALRKYEQIVSASRDLMALLNRDFVYEAVNERFLDYHRSTREEIVGRTVSEIMGENIFRKQIQPRLDQVLKGQTMNYRALFDFPGYGRRYMDVSYFPLLDNMGNLEGVVVNSRDITETRQLEEQLMHSQKMESIGTLAGGVAHEINNPINGIMNYAQLIIDRTGEDSPAKELAGEIIHETKRVANIVRNLLTFARHEKQSHSPAYLSDIISAVLSLVQAVMRHDQIDLQVDIPDELPKFNCRSQQVQQVLMNLITNARDSLNERFAGFNPQKQLLVFARLIEKEGRRYIRTTVEDFGTGIPAEIGDRIFDPFFTTKPKEKGTGLGLSISYGIVKDHHGELTVESEPGQYTRFHMDLPVDNGWKLS